MEKSGQHRILIISDDLTVDADLRKILGNITHSDKNKRRANSYYFQIDSETQIKRSITLIKKTQEKNNPYLLVFINLHVTPDKETIEAIAKISKIDLNLQLAICTTPGPASEKIIKRFKKIKHIFVLKKPFVRDDVCQQVDLLINKVERHQEIKNSFHVSTIKKSKPSIQFKELAAKAIESSADGVMIVRAEEPHYPIVYVNQAFEHMTGYSSEEVMERPCLFLQGEKRDQPEISNIFLALEKRKKGRALLRTYRKNGDVYWSEFHIAPIKNIEDAANHFVVLLYDVTSTKTVADKLIYRATHDPLTDLPNRALLIDRLTQSLVFSKRFGMMLAVLFFDLDYFKKINDNFGHDAGDALLQTVGARLSECVRESDTVARLGGDEFVVILTSLTQEEDYIPTLERILSLLAEPVYFEGKKITFTTSVGISLYSNNGQDAHTLLKKADIALYRAKELGRNNFQIYRDES